jgi:hypothetical protein
MEIKANSHQMIKRLVPPLALWLTTKLLETKKVKGALTEVDSYAYIGKRTAARSLKKVGRNARHNRAWLAASAAAFAVAIGCIAKAGSHSKR